MFGRKKREERGVRKPRKAGLPEPRVVGISDGSHGDHWCGVFGFEDGAHVDASVRALFSGLQRVHAIGRSRVRLRADHGALSVWGIGDGEGVETLYPVVAATQALPVSVAEIVEWTHVACSEAQVRGAGRATFGLDFFAVDFAENKQAYRSSEPVSIHLAGLAYVLEQASPMPDGVDAGFCAYVPTKDLTNGYEFDFIGTVLAADPVEALGESFWLLRVRLIRDDENPEMFNLPILVNEKNVRCAPPSIGDQVSGCFWLQGRIAEGP